MDDIYLHGKKRGNFSIRSTDNNKNRFSTKSFCGGFRG